MAVSSDGPPRPPPAVCLKLVGKPMEALSMRGVGKGSADKPSMLKAFVGLEGRLIVSWDLLKGLVGRLIEPPRDPTEAVESFLDRLEKIALALLVGLPGGELTSAEGAI